MLGSPPTIVTTSLGKVYRKGASRATVDALRDLNLTVEAGEVFGFLGQNGAGKSTTIKILTGLLRPSSGSADVCGHQAGSKEARASLGYLPENPSLPSRARVRELVVLSARLAGRGHSAVSEAEDWIDRLGLTPIVTRPAGRLSKGQAQLTALATALVGVPRLLILDEPMSGLDPVARKRVRDVLLSARDGGTSIFLSSHILGDMELLCDRVGVIRNGHMADVHALADVAGGNREVVVSGLATGQFDRLKGVRVVRHVDTDQILDVDDSMVNTVLQMCIGQGGTVKSIGDANGRLEDLVLSAIAEPELKLAAGGER